MTPNHQNEVAAEAKQPQDDANQEAWGIDPSDEQDVARLKRLAVLRAEQDKGALERAAEFSRVYAEEHAAPNSQKETP